MNKIQRQVIKELPHVICEVASYLIEGGVEEHHIVVHTTAITATYEEQCNYILAAYERLSADYFPHTTSVFLRFFLSDITNQRAILLQRISSVAGLTSIVGQAPLDGSKIALWIYFRSEVQLQKIDGGLMAGRGAYTHLWTSAFTEEEWATDAQTEFLFRSYAERLRGVGGCLLRNAVRTWLFVSDIDKNYAAVVAARNKIFRDEGLTRETHFISSTGIEAKLPSFTSGLQLDTYAICGLAEGQMRYLYASTHLNPTYEYGVSFERGTCVHYGDRTHIFISGTASIDHRGKILYEGDIRKQTYRMWENVEALLAEAGSSSEDMVCAFVYLRDIADVAVVQALFRDRFPTIPTIIVEAPVCRPGWLIEMECMAISSQGNAEYASL
ncbi:MAG: Rid family hydrolase [Phocaeicola sp.]|nr:Rid family hydrolase [Phocaeicola sp.]